MVHAQFKYFKASLAADQKQASTIKGALASLADEVHVATTKWMNKQETNGGLAVDDYMKKHMVFATGEAVSSAFGGLPAPSLPKPAALGLPGPSIAKSGGATLHKVLLQNPAALGLPAPSIQGPEAQGFTRSSGKGRRRP